LTKHSYILPTFSDGNLTGGHLTPAPPIGAGPADISH